MTPDLLLALAGFAFVSSITPGPNNLMLLASGANFGVKRTLPHMLGISLGHMLMLVLVGSGLKQVFVVFPLAYTLLKIASVVYLLYLAWKIATNTRPPEARKSQNGKPFTFLQAAAFQWVNPKAWVMALTAYSTYAPADPDIGTVALVAGVFAMTNLPSITTWVILGREMARLLHTPQRLRAFNITAALLLVASLAPVLLQPLAP
jgi:threonine/homoserine/homoserine lactone efflux protein